MQDGYYMTSFCLTVNTLKVHYCRNENLPISLSSHKNDMPKISPHNTV